MSCQSNALKASASSAAAGLSKTAGKAAYAAGVTATAVGGGVAGGAVGGVGGTAIGAISGTALGAVMGPGGAISGLMAGSVAGGLGGAMMGGVVGTKLGIKGAQRLAGKKPEQAEDGQLTRGDRVAVRAGRVAGAVGGAMIGADIGGILGPAGSAVGAGVGAVAGARGVGGSMERDRKLKRWDQGAAGQKAKSEFIAKTKAAKENKGPGLKGQLGYFKQVVKLQNEHDTRRNREALGE